MLPQSLDQFVSPLISGQFLREIYGTRPVYIPGQMDRFSDLLPWDVINDILFQHRLKLDDERFKIAKDGNITFVTSPKYRLKIRYSSKRILLAPIITDLPHPSTSRIKNQIA